MGEDFWNLSGTGQQTGLTSNTGLFGNNLNQPTTMNQQLGNTDLAGLQGNQSFWNNASLGLGAVNSLANMYFGNRQLNQAEDQLAFQKEAFWANYNQQVADRELAAKRRAIASGSN